MRAVDLDLRELLDFEPQGGVLRFAGPRALLFDAVALGLLLRELIATIGHTGARGVLTRFGYAHGWRMAEVLRSGFPWETDQEWRIAGGRLHRLLGLVIPEPWCRGASARRGPPPALRGGHLARVLRGGAAPAPRRAVGRAGVLDPVRATPAGTSPCCNGREIVCVEERCAGKGDALCTMVGRPREEWGGAHASVLAFYERECLEMALKRVTGALRRVERRPPGRGRASSGSARTRSPPASSPAARPCARWWTWRAGWPRSTPPRSSRARAASARRCWRGSSTRSRAGSVTPSWPSTAAPCRRACWRASSSGTPGARSPAPPRIAPASSRRPAEARSSSTRSATCRRRCR